MSRGVFCLLLLSSPFICADGETEDVYDPATDTYRRSKKYTYDLSSLCPVAPSQEAIDCKYNYQASTHVHNMITKSQTPEQAFGTTFDVMKCTVNKVPSYEISIGIYCYFMGVIQNLLTKFGELKDADYETAHKYLIDLRDEMKKETRPDIVTMYQDLWNGLTKELSIDQLNELNGTTGTAAT